MPIKVTPREVKQDTINGITVSVLELDAKTKDKDGKETKFTYQFPAFPDATTVDELVTALTYQNSKKETISGESVLRDYVNTSLKNERRSQKLAEINGILKLRENPEAAFEAMVNQLVVAYGVPRAIAEANVRATIEMGAKLRAEAEGSTEQATV